MGLTSGTKLGPYMIQSPLGVGGMGEMYKALDTRLDRAVAIKALRGMPTACGASSRKPAPSLRIRNILALYDIGTQDSATYLQPIS
jgi:serine/threonine protein kinase